MMDRTCVAVSPKMDVMVLGSAEGGCTLFDMLLNKVLTRIPMKEVAKKLMWLPNSTGVVVITEENAAILVQLNNCLAVE